MKEPTKFNDVLGRLPPKQLARLAKLIEAERARRDGKANSGAGQMTDGEFRRWANQMISNATGDEENGE